MTPAQQRIFIGFFLLLISCVPVFQALAEASRGHSPQFLQVFTEPPTWANLRAYEKQLEDDSLVAQAIRPWIQHGQFRVFGDAGEKVLTGRGGWLFYRPDVRYLVEPVSEDGPLL